MTEQHPRPDDENKAKPNLGVAGRMAQDFIHSPLSPLLFIAMLFMGIMGLIFTPRQEDPQISVPMVDIFVQYPGASSEQVASLAIDPLQRILSEIPGVDHVYSAAQRGQGLVTVQFEVGEALELSIFKVHDKLQTNQDKIPPGVMPPLVKPKSIDDVPVVTLTLWSDDADDRELRLLSLDIMQHLKEIPETGQSFVIGGRSEQVRVEVIPEKLSGYGISIGQIAQTIQTANSEQKAGYVEIGDNFFDVYTGSFLHNAYDVESLMIGTHQGSPIYVRDVAKVTQEPEETSQIVNYFSGPAYGYKQQEDDPSIEIPTKTINGSSAVTIAVSKKINTNGVSVANQILSRIETLKRELIPSNVYVEVTRNYGQSANDKVNDLIKKLFIATGAVTFLVLWALGMRPAIVVTLVIPVVILLTVFSAWVLGFTIDRVSLFALIFSIGILVDDAIVVIENIYRRWLLKGETDTETAVDAVREVGNPTILATFTVVAALLPMGFVTGMMGPYMAPIPALGSVAMVFSLIAAFIFTPWLAMRLKPSMSLLHKMEEKEERDNEKLERLFRFILPPLFMNKTKGFIFLLSLVIAFFLAIAMFYVKMVEVKMLPLDNKPEFNVFVDMPEGTALPVTANLTYQLAEALRDKEKFPEVTSLQTYIGTSQPFDFNGMVRHYYLRSQPWQADIHVQLKHKKYRERSSHQIATEARRLLAELIGDTGAKITVVEMPPGPPVLQSVVAEVYGPDDETRRTVANHLTETFEKAETLSDVDNYIPNNYEVWRFNVDTEKAVRRGISVDTINKNLMMALGGFKIGDIKKETVLEPTHIVMQIPLSIRGELNRLYDLPIPSQMGTTVPLAELGHFVKVPQDTVIYYKDLRRVEYVVGDSIGRYLGDNKYSESAPIYAMLEVESLLKDYVTPDNVALHQGHYLGPPPADGRSGFEWAGEWTVTYETFRDMGLAFMVALVLIYILVVWLFGNFIVPAVIMAPIPLTLLGIIPGHWIADAEFTATSMIGWIALAGIIVRNSILLVDYSIHELQKGTPIQDAVILACKTRTRPIMITAFALVGGSSVILFDPIFQGMAISLLAGVLVSTILTLVVIPLGCISVGPAALCSTSTEDINGNGNGGGHVKHEVSDKPSFLSRFFSIIFAPITIVFYIIRGLFLLIWGTLSSLWQRGKPPEPVNYAATSQPTQQPTAAVKPEMEKTQTIADTTTTEKKEEPVKKPDEPVETVVETAIDSTATVVKTVESTEVKETQKTDEVIQPVVSEEKTVVETSAEAEKKIDKTVVTDIEETKQAENVVQSVVSEEKAVITEKSVEVTKETEVKKLLEKADHTVATKAEETQQVEEVVQPTISEEKEIAAEKSVDVVEEKTPEKVESEKTIPVESETAKVEDVEKKGVVDTQTDTTSTPKKTGRPRKATRKKATTAKKATTNRRGIRLKTNLPQDIDNKEDDKKE